MLSVTEGVVGVTAASGGSPSDELDTQVSEELMIRQMLEIQVSSANSYDSYCCLL